ncbi:ribosome recycling factor [Ancylomarina salipaludis]|uniref:Ribosome-recycling factor n=1 Tax=Ancylomarina salipaludis TaxID=2501299 RepID=A0A4Q1JMR6_9BACT|nr:ribosome recycling factor [Ancylomarina salipaludis]RXQ94988.1 ribosome recycling factor [Ancylomarina salipaludis]
MNEEVQMYLEDAKEKMDAAITHLETELVKIRAGKANVNMIAGVTVDYYGSMVPLSQVANVSVPDPRTLAVQPWERAMIGPIEKAIMNSNLGFNPDNNGEIIRINIPALTEERRNDLAKQAKAECENAKVSVRNARRDTIVELKKMVKDGLSEDLEKDAENDVQKLTDAYGKKIDELLVVKEKDIMTI